MTKPKAQAGNAAGVGVSKTMSPVDDKPVDDKPAESGENGGAPDPAQAETSTGVLLRRSCVDGIWYPHGSVIKASAGLCQALSADGAMDLHPAAVEYALKDGREVIEHAPDAPAELEA